MSERVTSPNTNEERQKRRIKVLRTRNRVLSGIVEHLIDRELSEENIERMVQEINSEY